MSTIKVNAIRSTADVEMYLAKVWVNFNGTGTVAIRGSGNVTSITDNGTGDYTVNFTSALPDVNYAAVASVDYNGTTSGSYGMAAFPVARNTASVRVCCLFGGGSGFYDQAMVAVSIFR